MSRSGLSPKAWIALITVYIIWGSTYLAIRVAVRTVPPFLAAGGRWFAAGLIMLAFGFRKGAAGKRPKRPSARQWWNAAVIGTALCFG
ncbi:MAG: EamA family transporter, partial [Actinomycetota bacterium]